ncbi:interferon-induced GTP-binding protein Mx2-like, partial [Ictalurus furcatus]|uniref:interferon-induced GTP-binding protein Mx2-like n=1 Tax=Ictalurus furcatus TaxID=66913 RepID=UPI00234FEFE7
CPLELKMKKSRKTDFWHGKIKYEDYEEEIEDPADVEQMIRKAQNEIAGTGMGISDKLISLEVTSSNIPDLTLIDLPGITRVAVKDQPENIGEQVNLGNSTLYDKRKATIPNLAEKLTLELVLHIELCLLQLEEQILMKLAEIQAEVDRYGSGPPIEPEQRIYSVTDKITAFTQDAINLTTGEEVKSMSYINIFSGLRKQFSLWKNDLVSGGETFNKRIEKEMQAYEEKYRGRELPSFLNYKTFEVIVKGQIKQLEEPAIRRLKEISDLIKKEFIQLAQSNFPGFPNLYKIAKVGPHIFTRKLYRQTLPTFAKSSRRTCSKEVHLTLVPAPS